ncbi:MAG: hypothetical protein DMF65_02040 [Acidobacteria bacterium]|nr:MAG: hypothetical protein DMF65_02040 [Acidobacteriota bacterium]
MRRRIFGPLLLLCMASASAQSPTVGDAPSGVAIVKFSWYNVTYRQGWDDSPDSAANHTLEDARSFPAQDSAATQFPRPIGSSPSTSSRGRDRSAQTRPSGGDEQTPASAPILSGRKVETYTYQVQVRNEGVGTIEAVDWEYNFMDAATRGLVARHRFQTFRRVKPGKSSTLSYTSATPPTRVISAAPHDGKSKPFEERIIIRCVAYSDGTVRWRADGAESDCDEIRKASEARRQ